MKRSVKSVGTMVPNFVSAVRRSILLQNTRTEPSYKSDRFAVFQYLCWPDSSSLKDKILCRKKAMNTFYFYRSLFFFQINRTVVEMVLVYMTMIVGVFDL